MCIRDRYRPTQKINRTSYSTQYPRPQDKTITTTKYFFLPYIKTLSEKITKILTRANNNTKIAYRNVNTINKPFTKTKDRDEIEIKSNVVNEI